MTKDDFIKLIDDLELEFDNNIVNKDLVCVDEREVKGNVKETLDAIGVFAEILKERLK